MLKDTLLKFFKIDGLIENIGDYVEVRAELLKLEIKEEVTKSMAKLSLVIGVVMIFLIGLMFMSIALALFIGKVINSQVLGFIIIGGLYLLLATVIFLYREPIRKELEKKINDIVKHKKK